MKASAYLTLDSTADIHGGAAALKRELDPLGGIFSVSVSEKTSSIAVDFDTSATGCDKIRKKVEALGYDVLNVRLDKHVM